MGTERKIRRRIGFTLDEEYAHAWTHALGIFFIVPAGPLLLIKNHQNSSMEVALAIYVISFLGVFMASTIYHWTKNRRFKARLQRLDHIAIYFFIAGSNTPYLMGLSEDQSAWFFLVFMWVLVLFGTTYKLLRIELPDWISLTYYLLMGWLGIVTIYLVSHEVQWLTFLMVLIGGVLYSVGAFFYHRDFIKWYHTVWHIFVLLGAFVHYAAIYYQLGFE